MFQITSGKLKKAQKVVIYGPEGVGKSTLASKFPSPIFIDCEGSTANMNVDRLPRPSSWEMLNQEIDYIKTNPLCKTLVIDTADWAEKLAMNTICSKHHVDGIEGLGYGKGYVYLEEEFGRFLNKLEDLTEIGVNVVLTAHAKITKFEQPDEMGAYDRWELKLQKKTSPLVKEWADMLLFANYKTLVVNVDGQGVSKGKNKGQGQKRTLYAEHTAAWDAKNRHNLPFEMDMDFKYLAHIFEGEIGAQDAKVNREAKEIPIYVEAQQAEAQTERLENASSKEEQVINEDIPFDTKEPEPSEQGEPLPMGGTLITDPEEIAKMERMFAEPLVRHKALNDLLLTNKVTVKELQAVVAEKGYYPADTNVDDYDVGFINGCLVSAWKQVYDMILERRKKVNENVKLF